MDGIRITGSALNAVASELHAAGAAFLNSGQISGGADFGSGSVEAAVSDYLAILVRASSSGGLESKAKAASASSIRSEFAEFDRRSAASISS